MNERLLRETTIALLLEKLIETERRYTCGGCTVSTWDVEILLSTQDSKSALAEHCAIGARLEALFPQLAQQPQVVDGEHHNTFTQSMPDKANWALVPPTVDSEALVKVIAALKDGRMP